MISEPGVAEALRVLATAMGLSRPTAVVEVVGGATPTTTTVCSAPCQLLRQVVSSTTPGVQVEVFDALSASGSPVFILKTQAVTLHQDFGSVEYDAPMSTGLTLRVTGNGFSAAAIIGEPTTCRRSISAQERRQEREHDDSDDAATATSGASEQRGGRETTTADTASVDDSRKRRD